jgi:RNA polymerase-binding transcription factor DksA
VEPDLDAIAQDLADVDTALGRLEDGTFGTDEVTGAALPDDVLADRPTARRSPPPDVS